MCSLSLQPVADTCSTAGVPDSLWLVHSLGGGGGGQITVCLLQEGVSYRREHFWACLIISSLLAAFTEMLTVPTHYRHSVSVG